MRSFLLAGAALLLLAGGERHSPGHLLVVGGGDQPESLVRRFVELAGGPGRARIVVVPMASGDPAAAGEEKAADLRALGADAKVLLLTRAQAESAGSARALDGVTGIWFTGGDQRPLAEALRRTPVLAAMRARYAAGAVIGGTSAGAAVMSDSMITGNQRRPDSLGYYGDEYDTVRRHYIEVVPGLGFLPGVIVDQHFLRRERHNRLLSVILERPTLLGVGIDEGTALEVEPDGSWQVLGRSVVVIYDARAARITPGSDSVLGTTGVRMHLLPAGSRFDPRRGTAVLPHR